MGTYTSSPPCPLRGLKSNDPLSPDYIVFAQEAKIAMKKDTFSEQEAVVKSDPQAAAIHLVHDNRISIKIWCHYMNLRIEMQR